MSDKTKRLCCFILAVHIEQKGEYFYLEYGTLRARWDTDSSWFLTLQEPLSKTGSTNYKGICGNFDGDALSESRELAGALLLVLE